MILEGGVAQGNGLLGEPLKLELLGTLSASWQGVPLPLTAPQLYAVLAYLHLQGPVPREELVEVFWPGRGSAHLRQALYRLKALPGADCWLVTGKQLSVQARSDFQELLRNLEGEADEDSLAQADHARVFLSGIPEHTPQFSEWLLEQRERLLHQHVQALGAQARRLTEAGSFTQARECLRQVTALDSLNERHYRQWMALEAQAGEMERALDIYEECSEALRRELNTVPSAETVALLRRIERQGNTQAQRAWLLRPGFSFAQASEALYGREHEQHQVQDLLAQHPGVLIQGLAGSGKTRLAWACVQDFLAGGTGHVLWLDVGIDGSEQVLSALSEALGLSGPLLPPQLRAVLGRQQVGLVVLDNVLSLSTLNALLPFLAGVPVLITSRQRFMSLPRVTLGALDRQASRELLLHHLGARSSAEDFPADLLLSLDDLAQLLRDHPYALRLAGRTLRGQSSALGLIQALKEVSLTSEDQARLQGLIEQSLAQLDGPAHEAYLGMGSLYVPHTTPELLSVALRRSISETEQALYSLVEHGLAQRESWPGSEQVMYRMHDLTFQAARSHRALLPGTVLHASCVFAQQWQEKPEVLACELPNLLGAAQEAARRPQGNQLSRLFSAWLGGNYLSARGFPVAQVSLLQQAVEEAVSARDWETASLLCGKLGDIQHALLREPLRASECYLEAARYAEQARQPARQAMVLALAGVLQALAGQSETAQALLSRATALAERSGDLFTQGRVLAQQGIAAARQADFSRAQTAFQEGRERLEKSLRTEKSAVAYASLIGVMGNQGQLALRQGKLDEALGFRREELHLASAQGAQVLMARAHAGLAEILSQQGQSAMALAEWDKSAAIYEKLNAFAQVVAIREQQEELRRCGGES